MNRSLLASCHVYALDLPFRSAFHQATGARRNSASLVVEVVDKEGLRGHGECLPRAYVGGGSVEGTLGRLKALVARLVASPPALENTPPEALLGLLDTWLEGAPADGDGNNARCALEMALLDLEGRRRGVSVGAMLGLTDHAEIRYSGVIAAEDPDAVQAIGFRMRAAGFSSFKIKVNGDPRRDRQRIEALRGAVGPDAEVRADANGALPLDEARERLEGLRALGLVAVEQPLPPALDEYLPVLQAQAGALDLVADESVLSVQDVRRLGEAQAVRGINVKLAKVGGLGKALEMLREARAWGLFAQLGAHVGETSLLTAAGLIFAGLVGDLRWHEGAAGLHLLAEEICEEPLQFGFGGGLGLARLEGRAGFGVKIDPSRLTRLASARERLV
jgi:muconate cycloisomerase